VAAAARARAGRGDRVSADAVRSPDGGRLARIRPVGANRPKALSEWSNALGRCATVGGARPGWLWPSQGHCTLDKELRRTYGFGCADYWTLFDAQGGTCRRCGHPPTPTRRLVVDEDHDTGEVGGLIHFGENRRIDQKTRRYLRTPPPVRLVVPPDRLRAAERRRQRKRRADRARAQPTPTAAAAAAEPGSYAAKLEAALRSSSHPSTDKGEPAR
jgi:hypothetical protein